MPNFKWWESERVLLRAIAADAERAARDLGTEDIEFIARPRQWHDHVAGGCEVSGHMVPAVSRIFMDLRQLDDCERPSVSCDHVEAR